MLNNDEKALFFHALTDLLMFHFILIGSIVVIYTIGYMAIVSANVYSLHSMKTFLEDN